MEKISNNISLIVLDAENMQVFLSENQWLDKVSFEKICKRYEFPSRNITIVVEHYYIDPVYRDAYYNFWSKAHFNWPRYCKRLFLFHDAHDCGEFLNNDCYDQLNSDFLGTIVVRPSYSDATDHTFGRTLLNPYKMVLVTKDGEVTHPYKYLETAKYKFHLLGNIYTTRAFPFLSQDGVVMKCAETSVCVLCDYFSTLLARYGEVLPSHIQAKLKERLPERILPSHGLYCNDISFLLGKFGFSPMIYADMEDTERAEYGKLETKSFDTKIGSAGGENCSGDDYTIEQTWDNQHITGFKEWFHYYVESAIPILTITAPSQEVNKHAALVIGHGQAQKSVDDCTIYRLGSLPCIDTAELYESYIVQDDNQIPYAEERMDRFTQQGNYKLSAFVVPLDRHVFLEASSAINICDTFIAQEQKMISDAIDNIILKCREKVRKTRDRGDEAYEQYEYMTESMSVSEDNPVTIRYYLANSAEFKRYRIKNAEVLKDKVFYADVPMPKTVWVAEISTYKLYKQGYAFAEIVIDATASNRSRVKGIILLKVANLGVYRSLEETYNDFKSKLEKKDQYTDLVPIFSLFSNFSNGVRSTNRELSK